MLGLTITLLTKAVGIEALDLLQRPRKLRENTALKDIRVPAVVYPQQSLSKAESESSK